MNNPRRKPFLALTAAYVVSVGAMLVWPLSGLATVVAIVASAVYAGMQIYWLEQDVARVERRRK